MIAIGLAACAGTAPADAPKVAEAGLVDSGTRVEATIQTALSSRTGKVGDTVRAVTSRDVSDGLGGVAIPAGSDVMLSVARLAHATTPQHPDGAIALVVHSVTVNGNARALAADIQPVPHHLEWRGETSGTPPAPVPNAYRDVIVSAGTPIVFTLAKSMHVTAR